MIVGMASIVAPTERGSLDMVKLLRANAMPDSVSKEGVDVGQFAGVEMNRIGSAMAFFMIGSMAVIICPSASGWKP